VIVTGYGSTKSEERAMAAGVSDFLHKPLSPEVIEQTAAKALAQGAPKTIVRLEEQVAVGQEIEAQAAKKPHVIRNMALFLCAPFIGLLYAVLLPFVGMGMLAYAALKKDK
jgi:DNA-binding NtrC family response regulator